MQPMNMGGIPHPHINRLLSLRLPEFFWLLSINLLLFEMPLQNATGFTYIDEAITGFLVISALSGLAGRESKDIRLNALGLKVLAFLGALVVLGIASNVVSSVTFDAKPILIDVFTCVKFPLALLCSTFVFRESRSIAILFEAEAKVALAVMAVFGILNLFVEIGGFGVDPRYGFRASFRFFFGHPENLNMAIVGLVIALLPHFKQNTKWIVLALFVMALSLRSKAFAFAAITAFFLIAWQNSGRIKGYQIFVALIAAFLVGYDQLNYYFTLDGAARNELTRVGVIVANRFFPFGSGFATYASSITADPAYYSSLYYQYGLYTVDGLAPGKASYLSDTFWPILVGQFGWFGAVLFSLMLAALFLFVYRVGTLSGQRLACILCFAYLLIESTAASAFFHPCAVYLAVCLGLILYDYRKMENHGS